jgi:hypothetical protein
MRVQPVVGSTCIYFATENVDAGEFPLIEEVNRMGAAGLPGRRGVRLCCATPGQASFAETSFGRSLVEHSGVVPFVDYQLFA